MKEILYLVKVVHLYMTQKLRNKSHILAKPHSYIIQISINQVTWK